MASTHPVQAAAPALDQEQHAEGANFLPCWLLLVFVAAVLLRGQEKIVAAWEPNSIVVLHSRAERSLRIHTGSRHAKCPCVRLD